MFISLFLIFLFVLLTNQASSTGSNKRKGLSHYTGESSTHKRHRPSYESINSQFQYGITINTFDIGDFVQVWNIDQWIKAKILNKLIKGKYALFDQYEVVILEYEGEQNIFYGKIFNRTPEYVRKCLNPNEPTGWNAFKIGDFVKFNNLDGDVVEWLEAIITGKKFTFIGTEKYKLKIIQRTGLNNQTITRAPNDIMMSLNNLGTFKVGEKAYMNVMVPRKTITWFEVVILGKTEEMYKVKKVTTGEKIKLYPYELHNLSETELEMLRM